MQRQSSSQPSLNVQFLVCLDPKCEEQPKIYQNIAKLDVHNKKSCMLCTFSELREKITNSKSDSCRLFGDDLIEGCIQYIDKWETETIEDFASRVKFEAYKVREQVSNLLSVLREYRDVYKAIITQDIKTLNRMINDIPLVVTPTEELKQIDIKIRDIVGDLHKFQNSIKDLQWTHNYVEKDKPDEPKKMKLVPSVIVQNYEELLRKQWNEYDKVKEIFVTRGPDCQFSINTIKYISKFKNVEKLSLKFYQQEISSISALSCLSQLNQVVYLTLWFYDNNIKDISPLKFLTAMTDLKKISLLFGHNKIQDISPLNIIGDLNYVENLQLVFHANNVTATQPLDFVMSLYVLKRLVLQFQWFGYLIVLIFQNSIPQEQQKQMIQHCQKLRCEFDIN